MQPVRIIARLEVKGRNVVKGIRMEGLRVVGTPGTMAEAYFDQGVDELVFNDTVASLYGRNHLADLLSLASDSIHIPLVAGGGVRSVEDFHRLLGAGADKVSINTQAVRTPDLIGEAARLFGAQCVVLDVQAKKQADGRYEAYVDNGRERTGRDVAAWAREAVDRGAGEILLTSVDRDGTTWGLDLDLIRTVTRTVPVPVIAAGGTKDAGDIVAAVREGGASAVAVSHLLHFGKATVADLKAAAAAAGLMVRPADANRWAA